jgi:hypothetical protein
MERSPPCSWTSKKCPCNQNQSVDLTQSPSRFQHSSSETWKEQFSISYGKTKKPRIAKTILNNKRTSEAINTPNLKLYYRAVVIKNYKVLVQRQTG